MTRVVIALLSGTLAIVPVGAAAAAPTGKTIGSGVRLKGSKIWYAQGKAVKPKTLSVDVVPVPEQAVKVQWSVVCQKPNASDPADHIAALAKSGQTSVRGATTVRLALPYANPPTCVATVYATLTKTGKLTLRLVQG